MPSKGALLARLHGRAVDSGEGVELHVHKIKTVVQPPESYLRRVENEISFLGITDRLRVGFIFRAERIDLDLFILDIEPTARMRWRLKLARLLTTEGLKRRYRGDRVRRGLVEGEEDLAFVSARRLRR